MSISLPKSKKLVPISEAAEILGISIDTVRRWDKKGILHSERPSGKNRYFSLAELEQVKFSQPLSISEVSKRLGISQSTIRRLEKRGLIKPERNEAGERLYSQESLENFLNSEYFLRQRQVEEKILEPLKEVESFDGLYPERSQGARGKETLIAETKHRILGAVQEEVREEVSKLVIFKKAFYGAGLFLVTLIILLISIITVLFLLFPENTAYFFGYIRKTPTVASQNQAKLAEIEENGQVLGAKYAPPPTSQGQVLGLALKPISKISLGIVKQVAPQTYAKIVPKRIIEDVNDILSIDDQGNITPLYNVKFLDSSYLEIPDAGLVENFNASFIRGKIIPEEEGTIAVIKDDGTITNLVINQDNISIGSVTTIEIADSTVATSDLADGSVTNLKIADGAITSGKLALGLSVLSKDSVKSEHIKNGEVKGEDIAGNVLDTSHLTSILTFDNGDFLDLARITHSSTSQMGLLLPNTSSASPSNPASGEGYLAYDTSDNQVIFYNGSSWGTVGSGDITGVTAGSGLTGGGGSGAVTLTVGAGTGITVNADDVAIDTSAALTWTGAPTFNALVTLSSSGITGGGLSSNCSGSSSKLLWSSSSNNFSCGTDLNTGGSGGAGGWIDYGSTVGLQTITANMGIGTSQSVANAKVHIKANADSTGLALITTNNADNNFGLVVLDNGRVGIGTTSPDYNFRVQGTGYFTGFVGIGSSLNVSGNVGVGSSLSVTSAAALTTLNVSGISNLVGNVGLGNSLNVTSLINTSGLNVSGNSILSTLSTTGNVSIGSSLTVSSAGAFRLSGQNCSGLTNAGKLTTDSSGNVYCAADISGGSIDGSGGLNQVTFWTDTDSLSGNNAFYWDNAGMRLGIGSSAPGGRLGVFGGVGVGSSYGFSTLPAAAINGMVVEGNIGIGTSSPTSSLYVAGNAGIGWTGVNLSSSIPGLGLSVFGNVGVGTTSPQYALQVIGNVGIGTSLTVTSLVNTTGLNVSGTSTLGTGYASTLTSSGNVGVGASINIAGLTYSLGGLRVNGYADLTGNVGISSSLTVSSGSIFSSFVNISSLLGAGLSSCSDTTNSKLLYNAQTGNFSCGTDQNSGGGGNVSGWYDFGSTVTLLTPADNVGIGTSPSLTSAKLHIQGSGDGGGLLLYTVNNSNNTQGLTVLDNGNVGIGTTSTGGRLIVYGGNVGIGISVPFQTLAIQGNVGIGFSGINVVVPNNGLAVLGNVGIGTTTANHALNVSGNIGVGSSIITSATRLDIVGNVGISQSLTVGSALQLQSYNCSGLSSGGKLTTDSSGRVVCQDDGGGGGISGSGADGQITFWTSSSAISGNNTFFWNNGLNRLGIGSSAPGSTLGVFGAVGIGSSYGYATLPTSAVDGLVVQGNIGIGTSSPTAALYVAGNVGIGWTGVNLSSSIPGLGLSVFGNVGVGTTSPQYPLQVIGNVGIGTSLTVTSLINTTGLNVTSTSSLGTGFASTLTSSGNVGVGASLSVTSAAALTTLNVTGISNLVGNVGIGGTGTFNSLIQGLSGLTVNAHTSLATLSSSGNVSIGSSLTVSSTGAFRLSGQNCSGLTNAGKLTTDSSGNVYCAADTGGSIDGSGALNQVTFWTDTDSLSGNNAFYWNNSLMRLGIGSSAPGSTLGVFGSVGIGSSYGYGILPASLANGLAVQGNVAIGATAAGGSLVIVGGNVGIGTTSPRLPLEVFGSSGYAAAFIAGNVGIGTTAPAFTLDISGNVGISQSLTVTSTSALTSLNVSSISNLVGNVGIGGTGTFNSLIQGLSGLTVAAHTGLATLSTTGNVSIGASMTVSSTGAFTLSGQNCSSLTGGGKLTTNSTGNVFCSADSGSGITSASGGTNQVTFWSASDTLSGNNSFFWNNALMRLGIGSSAPGTTLGVFGSVGVGSSYAYSTLPTSAADGLVVQGNIGIGTSSPTAALYVAGNVGIGWTGVNLSSTIPGLGLSVFGNVGIGTTSPSYPLQVVGNVGIGTSLTVTSLVNTTGLNVSGTSTLGTAYASTLTSSGNVAVGTSLNVTSGVNLLSSLAVSGHSSLSTLSTTGATNLGGTLTFTGVGLDITTGNNEALTLIPNGTGNVGIGFSSPYGRLFVLGSGTGTGIIFQTVSSIQTQGLTVLDNGNVGIGTTNPRAGLDITTNVGIGYSGIAAGSYPSLGLVVQGNVGIGTSNPGLAKVSIIGGNVGIGNSNPAYALDVTGNVGIGASLTVSSTGAFRLSGQNCSGLTNAGKLTTDSSGNVYCAADISGGGSIDGSGALNQVTFWTDADSLSGNNAFYWDNVGMRLGIGSSAPGGKLGVFGSVGIGSSYGFATLPASALDGLVVQGNIGIGTSSPTSSLYVAGNVGIGWTGVNLSSVIPGLGLSVFGNVGIGTTSPGYGLQVIGNSGIGASLTVGSALQLQSYNCSGLTNGGKLTADSSGRIVCQADAGAASSVSGDGALGQVTFWTDTTVLDGVNNFFWDNTNLRLGIGSSAPGARLGVFGSVGIGSSYGYSTLPASAVDGLVVQGNIGIGTSSPTAALYVANNVGIGWTGVNLSSQIPGLGLSVFGNVGIGTTSPAFQLHATGNVGLGRTVTFTSSQYASCTALKTDSSGNMVCGGAVDSVTPNVYTSDDTWNRPTNTRFAQVIVTGSGGGGGGAAGVASDTTTEVAGGGGGAGGTAIEMLTAAQLGTSQAVTVGSAGTAGGSDGSDGGTGNTSSLGSLLSATGGSAGDGIASGNTGISGLSVGGGVGSGGDINLTGGEGQAGAAVAEFATGGNGGASYWGGGGGGGEADAAETTAGNNGVAPGSGGGGGAEVDDQNSPWAAGGAGAGGIVVVFAYTGSGGDLAEWYETRMGVEPGDVVSISNESLEYESFALGLQNLSILEKATPGSSVVGVISTLPFQVIGGDLLGASKNAKPVALAGRVPVKVSEENGKILAGDSLTISQTAGVAMRATKAGMTIGRALEDADCKKDEICKVSLLVNTSYSTGTLLKESLKEDGIDLDAIPEDLDVGRIILAQMLRKKQDIVDQTKLSEIYTDRLTAGLEIISPRVVTKNLVAEEIEPLETDLTVKLTSDGRFIIVGAGEATDDAKEVVTIDSMGNATFTGTVTADKIRANQIEGLELVVARIKSLESREEATESGQEDDLVLQTASSSAQSASKLVEGLQMEGETLYVKKDTIFDRLVYILESLTVRNLIVTDWAQFLADVLFKGNITFDGRPTFNKDTAGFAVINKGSDSVEITFEKEYAQIPLVNVTITLDQEVTDEDKALLDSQALQKKEQAYQNKEQAILGSNLSYIVVKRTTKGFTIKLNKETPEDIKFTWSALAVKDAKTSNSQPSPSPSPTLTPSPTPTPTPSPTPSETPSPSPSSSPSPSPTPKPQSTTIPSPKIITIKETELGYLRVRDGPATSYNEIGQVQIGATFEVFEESEKWYQIEYEDGKYGWVSGNYVTIN